MTSRPKAVQAPVRADATAPSRQPLKFGQGNAKLSACVTTFSIPAGHSCPFARDCLSWADRRTGHIKDGKRTAFRCYAASMEARHSSVRRSRWHNFEQLRRCRGSKEMTRLILDSVSPFYRILRVHDSGDYFSQPYFDAWVEVARERPDMTVYAYVKALPFWVRRLALVGDGHQPGEVSNLVLTASRGGTRDRLIELYGLRSAVVVYSRNEAEGMGGCESTTTTAWP